MSFQYYYRGPQEGEVTIQVTSNLERPLSIRVAEDDNQTTAMINLPANEIDRLIEGLLAAKSKLPILSHTGYASSVTSSD